MDTPTFRPAPYFDPKELRVELTALFNAHGTSAEARPAVLDRCKRLVKAARQQAREQLEADGKGRKCAHGLARFQDELIALLFDYTVAHVYRATNPSDAERMAVVATGGYGRGLLAPGSDIDLLFLLPYKQTPWGESVAEYMLYLLWDLGFKVGHATRTVDECLKMAQQDMTIRTALLDIRLVHGDAQLFAELTDRLRREVVQGTARTFIDGKLAERDERHRRAGESRYLVEPNVKDGKGGLRDLHTLLWLAKYLYGKEVGPETIEEKIFTPRNTPPSAARGLPVERALPPALPHRPRRGTAHLRLAARDGRAARIPNEIRSARRRALHEALFPGRQGRRRSDGHPLRRARNAAGQALAGLAADLISGWKLRRQVRQLTDFRIENDRFNVADPEVFKRDPVNLIRFFAQAELTNAHLHPDAIRLLRQSLRLIDDRLRNDPEANRLFLDLVAARSNPENTLRRMNEAGVLGRFMPDFGQIVAMMQFNMYHHYTVDEHLIRAVGRSAKIEHGESADEHPLSNQIIKSIQNRRALYVARSCTTSPRAGPRTIRSLAVKSPAGCARASALRPRRPRRWPGWSSST